MKIYISKDHVKVPFQDPDEKRLLVLL